MLIHGASGAVGLAATQLAVSLGCVVVGSAGTAAGLEAVTAAGAQFVANQREEGYLQASGEGGGGKQGWCGAQRARCGPCDQQHSTLGCLS